MSGVAASLAQTPSRTEGAPGVASVEFENESMVALWVHMAPHEKTPMHDIVGPRLVILLTDAHLKDTGPGGTATEYNRPSGSIDRITPRRHVGENLCDQSLEFLAIIPKSGIVPHPHATPPH
jgi:hypothetical protein